MSKTIPAFLAACSLTLSLPAPRLRAEPALLAGAARVKTTPTVEKFTDSNKNRRYDAGEPFQDDNRNGRWDPLWLAGYDSGRSALGIHDELSARALAFTQGDTTALFISLDLIGYLFDEVAIVKKAIREKWGIPPHQILIASTHDHSGPDAIGLWGENGKSGRDPAYLEFLRERILECAGQALRNRKPAKLYFGKIRYSLPIEDSRPPNVKNELLVTLRVADGQDNTIATIVNYAMHAEVLGPKNRMVTADYPGALRETMESRLGGTCLFFPADIGGMQSPFVLFHSFWSSRRVGQAVAEKAILSLRNQKPVEAATLSVTGRNVFLPVDNPRFLGAIQKGLFGDADKFAKKEGGKILLPSDFSVVRLGPALFVSVPGEAFPEVGNVIREKMNADYKFTLGLCNNEIGYIVPEEQWNDGGYEESMSLGPRTAGLVEQTLSQLLSK